MTYVHSFSRIGGYMANLALPTMTYDPITFQPQRHSPFGFMVRLSPTLLKYMGGKVDEYGFRVPYVGNGTWEKIPPMYKLRGRVQEFVKRFPMIYHKICYPDMSGEMMDYSNSIVHASQFIHFTYTIDGCSFTEFGKGEDYRFDTALSVRVNPESYWAVKNNMYRLYFQWKGELTLNEKGDVDDVEVTDLAFCMNEKVDI